MITHLQFPPSIDGLGVKRWSVPAGNGLTLFIFERPPAWLADPTPYMLRLMNEATGEHKATYYAATQQEAISLANWVLTVEGQP